MHFTKIRTPSSKTEYKPKSGKAQPQGITQHKDCLVFLFRNYVIPGRHRLDIALKKCP